MPVKTSVLVFVSIIGAVLLAAIAIVLTPTYASPRTPTKARCLSNLKQDALALLMYTEDYGGSLPPAAIWMDASKPYIKNEDLLSCPELGDIRIPGYAFNRALDKADIRKMSGPETIPFVYDSVELKRNASDAVSSLPNPGRHKGMNVISYLDGHAKAVKSP